MNAVNVKIVDVDGEQALKGHAAPLYQVAGADDFETLPGKDGKRLVAAYIEMDLAGKLRGVADGSNPQPEDVLRGKVRRYGVPADVNGRALVDTLHVIRPLLKRVHGGHTWDQEMEAGRLTPDAVAAEKEVRAQLQKLWEARVRDGQVAAKQPAECLLARTATGLTVAPTEEEQQELHAEKSIEVNEVSLKRVWSNENGCAEFQAGDGKVWFRDHGPRIEVVNREDESIVAALQIAAEKFGGIVTISGPPEFRERAAKLAAHLDIGVLDQDLAGLVEHEKGVIGGVEIEPGEEQEQEFSSAIGR